jgi:outer membrane PBP1 activator LpoA protein
MLYPDDGAGKRRADAFRAHWNRLGGALVGESAFDPGAAAYPAKIQGLLARGDADFLFLAANADQAQSIFPRIRKDAADLPVIATSDVYSGASDPVRDRALAGLYFVDMPWMLGVEKRNDPLRRADIKSSAAYLATPLGRRLYAMGIDAYRLAPRLARLASEPGSTFAGQTGRLSLDAMGRVRRELVLGRFTESGPEAVAGMKKAARAAQTRSPRPEPTNRG